MLHMLYMNSSIEFKNLNLLGCATVLHKATGPLCRTLKHTFLHMESLLSKRLLSLNMFVELIFLFSKIQ